MNQSNSKLSDLAEAEKELIHQMKEDAQIWELGNILMDKATGVSDKNSGLEHMAFLLDYLYKNYVSKTKKIQELQSETKIVNGKEYRIDISQIKFMYEYMAVQLLKAGGFISVNG